MVDSFDNTGAQMNGATRNNKRPILLMAGADFIGKKINLPAQEVLARNYLGEDGTPNTNRMRADFPQHEDFYRALEDKRLTTSEGMTKALNDLRTMVTNGSIPRVTLVDVDKLTSISEHLKSGGLLNEHQIQDIKSFAQKVGENTTTGQYHVDRGQTGGLVASTPTLPSSGMDVVKLS